MKTPIAVVCLGLAVAGQPRPVYVSSRFTEKEIQTVDMKTIRLGDSVIMGSPVDILGDRYRFVTDSMGNPHPYKLGNLKREKYAIVALRKDGAIKAVDPKGGEWFFIWSKADGDGEVMWIPKTTDRRFGIF